MMKAVILLSVLAVAFATECGENEHFESCGTACPLTCENYQNPPKVCVLRCDIGCQCDKGYVRNAEGRCVRPEQCPSSAPKQCGENQHYESCGTACPLTCKNYENPPKFCILMCNPGCHCDEGYVKTDDGECVRPEECPAQGVPVCGENKHYLECGTACPLTCDNYDNPPKICPAVCVTGCQCKPGFVQTHDMRCVKVEECPSKASADEELCSLPAKVGMCRGYFPRFFFNQETGKCEKFIYGGCGGNKNNFATEEECHNTCGSS